jgi:predicted O-linked N-acetylglucosamine transferase (SPINDLY family)
MTPSAPTLALGQWYHRAGDFPRAEHVYRQLLQIGPPSAELLFFLGSACQAQNKLDDAVIHLRQAMRLRSDFPEALHNLGVALATQGHDTEAAEALRQAAQARPGWLEPLLALGTLSQEQGRLDEAIGCFQHALAIQDSAELHNKLGSAFALRGEHRAAAAHFSEALRQEPRYTVAHSNLLLALGHDPDQTPSALLAEHRWWDRLHGQGLALRTSFGNPVDSERRLRIGYVSPDFRRGPLASFITPVLAAHDRAQTEIFAYAELTRSDEVTEQLQGLVSGWRMTRSHTDAQVAQQIRADGIDILVDLAGHTANHRLGVFAHKPAPVQVTWLGYAGTTGLATMNYRLTDAISDPPGEPICHTEELVRLADCFCCYAPPADAPAVGVGPCGDGNRITFGAPHKLFKLNDGVIGLWARALQSVPDSRLLVCRNTLNGETLEFWRRQFIDKGIAADRLELRQAIKTEGGYLSTYQSWLWRSSLWTFCWTPFRGLATLLLARHCGWAYP